MIPAITAERPKIYSVTLIMMNRDGSLISAWRTGSIFIRQKRTSCAAEAEADALTTGYNDERIAYGRKKMEQISATGAEMVVVPCHSCHGQLNNIKKEYGMENLTCKIPLGACCRLPYTVILLKPYHICGLTIT